MSADAPRRRFDFDTLSPLERYKLLIGSVVPRPIAWVTTVDPEGRVNAAPYSFFNVLSHDPALLALGVENHADMRRKDTSNNIRLTQEFTVNIVDHALVEAMNVTAVPFPPEVDELAAAGLTAVPGARVGCPYIAEAPVALECRNYTTLSIGRSREIVLGEVLAMHIRADLVNERLHVDPAGLDAVGRLGGQGYSTLRDRFDLPSMSLARWQESLAATEES
ncbi:flavin reductase family protein (plasmid) [Paroceanicella profunda]|uniref:Flavin reductase family protein n=1 Tax=Paroceanicella profunda TaxID=2579971 RepID=A0A5B8FJB3_9RHOB|nr:flavin reductase family protein [Paroceanicella profunda]QDL93794.1 flavin reductase family protein [Paroceanicella profunda]QDL94257.1 flavin reductase family protein [Paroceanicella profunda]